MPQIDFLAMSLQLFIILRYPPEGFTVFFRTRIVCICSCIINIYCLASNAMPLNPKTVYITNYLAVPSSSFSEGSLRESIIPRFILAGSSAQFDRPMKATREKLFSVSMTSSSLISLSSKRGCKVFRGIFGESSASPTSSSTTTEANLSNTVSAFLRS